MIKLFSGNSDLRLNNEAVTTKRISVLEVSDFNGIDNEELADGILEDIDNVVSEEEW